jgi:6-pyruvoyltetrahydropterin/6-carboxytetrahydropterin synthase
MPLTLMRRIRFCAGHRLLGHGGKCEYFHGHNFIADFFVTGDDVDEVGRVVDFAELKRVLKGWIDEHWDHSFILSEDDENGIAALDMVVPRRYYLLPYNPTAENLATYLLEEVCPPLFQNMNIRATKVIVWETEEAYSEATTSGVADPCSAGLARSVGTR